MPQSPNLKDFLQCVATVTVPLANGLSVAYDASTVLSLRQTMAHLAEGGISQLEMLTRLADIKRASDYLALRELGLMLGPDASELNSYHEAVLEGDQVKMLPKIELTALGEPLNQAGMQLQKLAAMSADAYAASLDEDELDTEDYLDGELDNEGGE